MASTAAAAAAAAIAPADEERRRRLLAHVNQSHTRELAHYLRHYAGVSPADAPAAAAAAADRPSLRDITLQGMRIRTPAGRDYAVAFDPPLDSWDQVRARLVDMDAVARRRLGIADVYVTEYLAPGPFDAAVFAAVVVFFASAAALPCIVPGTRAWALLDAGFPGGPDAFCRLTRLLFLPVVAIHLTESAFFDRKLRRHGVDRGTRLWWAWVSSCFFEGLCAHRRLGRLVARSQAQKQAKAE